MAPGLTSLEGDYRGGNKDETGAYGETDKDEVGEGVREGGGWYGGRELEEGEQW